MVDLAHTHRHRHTHAKNFCFHNYSITDSDYSDTVRRWFCPLFRDPHPLLEEYSKGDQIQIFLCCLACRYNFKIKHTQRK